MRAHEVTLTARARSLGRGVKARPTDPYYDSWLQFPVWVKRLLELMCDDGLHWSRADDGKPIVLEPHAACHSRLSDAKTAESAKP